MTRGEAKKAKDKLYNVDFDYDGDELIDKIYDDFESEKQNPWHTGTPTDRNGLFLIQTKGKNYFIVKWQDGFWGDINGDDCLEDEDIVKWQKIDEGEVTNG